MLFVCFLFSFLYPHYPFVFRINRDNSKMHQAVKLLCDLGSKALICRCINSSSFI